MTNVQIKKFLRGFCTNFLFLSFVFPFRLHSFVNQHQLQTSETFQEMSKSTTESHPYISANRVKLCLIHVLIGQGRGSRKPAQALRESWGDHALMQRSPGNSGLEFPGEQSLHCRSHCSVYSRPTQWCGDNQPHVEIILVKIRHDPHSKELSPLHWLL